MVMLQRIRRNRIVRIDHLTDAQALALEDDAPGPDRHVAARRELARVRRMIDDLPPRCREVFELGRVDGVSQREIDERLDLPENTVEPQAIRGPQLILQRSEERSGGKEGVSACRSRWWRHHYQKKTN